MGLRGGEGLRRGRERAWRRMGREGWREKERRQRSLRERDKEREGKVEQKLKRWGGRGRSCREGDGDLPSSVWVKGVSVGGGLGVVVHRVTHRGLQAGARPTYPNPRRLLTCCSD